MEKRELGKSGLAVAPLAFGGNVFGWTLDEKSSFPILDAFIASGCNFIDTADTYSTWVPGNKGGESETIIGNWLKSRGGRDRVILATKIGNNMGPGRRGLAPAYIRQSIDDSLKRLQTDYVDLYQSHIDDADTPLEETLQTYGDLIRAGKIRAIGASNYKAPRLQEALAVSKRHGYPRYQSLQPLYNLYDRADFEGGLQQLCIAENIGVINYSTLASGFLTGKYRAEADFEKHARGSRTKKYFNERGMRVLQALDQVSARYKANPAQISFAWLLSRPGITAPIASATSVAQLDNLVKAIQIKLDREAVDLLDRASG